MSLLNNVATDSSIQDETDSVGGGGVLESGLYPMKVTMAYLEKSAGGALAVSLHLEGVNGGQTRQKLWVASGDAKGNKNYYETQQGEKRYLPGFNNANALCLLTVGKELGQMTTEEKLVKIYSFDAGAEVPTKVEVLTDLIGQEILTGLQKQIVDKRVKADDGSYQPTGETREENEIDKFFRASDRMTTAEIRAEATEAAFAETWENKWTGNTRDRSSKGGTGQTGAPSTPAANAPAAGKKPTASLFGS